MGADLNLSLTEDASKSVTGDLPTTTFTAAKYKGLYGTLAVNKAGATQTATYTPDVRLQALKHGQVVTETLAAGAPDSVITLTGVNDAAKFTGTFAGKLLEGQPNYLVGGPVKVLDLDTGEASILGFLQTAEDGTPSVGASFTTDYGVFAWDSTLSKWTFSGDSEAIAGLSTKQTATATAYLVSADGSRAKLSVLITGKDPASPSTGNIIGEVTEDSDLYTNNFLTSKGILKLSSSEEATIPLVGSFQARSYYSKYGSLSVKADGSWDYALVNFLPAVQKLKGTQSLLDTFTVLHSDGSSEKVSLRVKGNTFAPNTGTADPDDYVDESLGGFAEIQVKAGATGTSLTKGNMILFDSNFKLPAITFTGLKVKNPLTGEIIYSGGLFSGLTEEQRTKVGDYGTFKLNIDGTWTYTLNNEHPDVKSLSGSKFLTDTMAPWPLYNIAVRIIGANDKAVITPSEQPRSLVEDDVLVVDGRQLLKSTGQLTITDPDTGESLFKASTFTDKFGTFTIGADGQWQFLADNANPLIQKLAEGQTLKATYSVESYDGSAKSSVTITINGAAGGTATNFSGNSGAVTDGGLEQYTGQIYDLDAGNKVPKVKLAKTLDTELGFFGLNLDGSWSYKLDADAVVSEKTVESFTVDVYGTETSVDDVTLSVDLYPSVIPVV
ncbi:MAG: hypothetical protein RL095_717 [Verrucomicrobiota bacterium]|jgi:VCBS repeat-containing protein